MTDGLPGWLIAAMADVPPPDRVREPEGFMVGLASGDRLHFLDWGEPAGLREGADASGGRAVLVIHGLGQTAWSWAPVARRLSPVVRTIAVDLRGHGLSDAPTSGYDPERLADDIATIAASLGLGDEVGSDRPGTHAPGLVLAGHGFGALVATWAAAALAGTVSGVVLVDGGWEDLEHATGQDADEFLREFGDPPEVLASLGAFLADRASYDPATWDEDQERASRALVVETSAGKVVPATRPHVLEACVRTMFAFPPGPTLVDLDVPMRALVAVPDPSVSASRDAALAAVAAARLAAGRTPLLTARLEGLGHNLLRYRPDLVAAAVLDLAPRAGDRATDGPAVRMNA